jgi:hypothetical protein
MKFDPMVDGAVAEISTNALPLASEVVAAPVPAPGFTTTEYPMPSTLVLMALSPVPAGMGEVPTINKTLACVGTGRTAEASLENALRSPREVVDRTT